MEVTSTIETFLNYQKEIIDLERETPSHNTFDSYTEEKQDDIRAKTRRSLNIIFEDYIEWIIETNGGKTFLRIHMRKSFELLLQIDHSNLIYIEHILDDDRLRGRGDIWKEYERIFKEKLAK